MFIKDISRNRIVIPVSIVISLIMTGLSAIFLQTLLPSTQPDNLIWNWVEGWKQYLQQGIFINYIVTLAAGWSVFKINETFSLSHYRSYLPFVFYLLLQITNPYLQFISEGTLAVLLGLPTIAILFASYQREQASEYGFWVGLLWGTLALFWTKALLYLPLFLIGFWLMRSWRFKAFLSILIGAIAPFWLQFSWWFFKGEILPFTNQFHELYHYVPKAITSIPLALQINLGATLLIAIIAGFYLLVTNIREKVRTQACFSFLILLCVLSATLCLIDSDNITGHLSLFYITVAFLASNIFLKVQTKPTGFLFFIIIAAYFASYIFSLWII